MSCCAPAKSSCFGNFEGWWMVVVFFIFLVFQECIEEICISDWIPFLIVVLILCSYDVFEC